MKYAVGEKIIEVYKQQMLLPHTKKIGEISIKMYQFYPGISDYKLAKRLVNLCFQLIFTLGEKIFNFCCKCF